MAGAHPAAGQGQPYGGQPAPPPVGRPNPQVTFPQESQSNLPTGANSQIAKWVSIIATVLAASGWGGVNILEIRDDARAARYEATQARKELEALRVISTQQAEVIGELRTTVARLEERIAAGQ